MRAVVVAVGDELLSGVVVNTNAAAVGELLLSAGVEVVRSVCVGDDEDAIVEVLRSASATARVVVVTGGLGPTPDDRTREAVARLLGSSLERDESVVEQIRERFRSLGREMPASNARQADVPRGATAIPNPWGTAPGIRVELPNAVVYAVPGVPSECRRMVAERVLPELAERTGELRRVRTRTLRCCGVPESELADELADLVSTDDPVLAYLPGSGEVRLRFTSRAVDAADRLARAEATVRQRFGAAVYGADDDTLESVVGSLLGSRGETVATAESCTAGALAARLANVPGASAWLRGGVVSYATDLKTSALGVDSALLEREGAVSEPVALAMADGVRSRLDADVGVAVTCAAGPDPHAGAEPGTTILAVVSDGARASRGLRIPGDRAQVRLFATTFALNLLRLHLLG